MAGTHAFRHVLHLYHVVVRKRHQTRSTRKSMSQELQLVVQQCGEALRRSMELDPSITARAPLFDSVVSVSEKQLSDRTTHTRGTRERSDAGMPAEPVIGGFWLLCLNVQYLQSILGIVQLPP